MTEVRLYHHPDCKKVNPQASTNTQGETQCTCNVEVVILYLHKLEMENAEKAEVLQEMIDMMESGDEHGEGSDWYKKAKEVMGYPDE